MGTRISGTIRVLILKQKPQDAIISILKLIKFMNQSIRLSEREIYSNSKNFGELWFTSLEQHEPFTSRKHANGLFRSRDGNHLHAFSRKMVYLSLFL